METNYDVIIAGGGPAGLSAALALGRSLRRVLVIDTGQPRNRYAEHMHTVLGNEGVSPVELIARGREEAAAYGVEYDDGPVTAVDATDGGVTATTPAATVTARMLLLATGVRDDLPAIPGLRERWGRSVLHCPYCHGWEVRGRRLGVLGLSPMALHQAELIRQWSDDVVFLTGAMDPVDPAALDRLRARGIEVVTSPVVEVVGPGEDVAGVVLADGATVDLGAIFTGGTLVPHDELVSGLGLDRSDTPAGSFLTVDAMGRTSHPRVWAAGNVVNPMANVPISVAAGVTAGAGINMALVTEDFDTAHAAAYWETRYAENERVWSGRVNATMADVVAGLPPGDALELGSGEGGDAVWLAEQGWQVTAVDISPTAVARAAKGASARGVAERITWIAHDLATWRTEATFDLVTASFLHSTVALPRAEILRRAAGTVRPGGHLLIVSHVFETDEDVPPWAWSRSSDGHEHAQAPDLPLPRDEIDDLALDPAQWDVEIVEIRRREATGPDGVQTAMIKDGVILARRTAAPSRSRSGDSAALVAE